MHGLHYQHNFISLRVCMKSLMMKISAVLLVLWYCLSIIGFDVHTCRETGDSFVHVSFTAHSCNDIHDYHSDTDCEHDCSSHCDEPSEHHHDDDCCEDEYQVISLTGLRSDDDIKDCIHGNVCPCILEYESDTYTVYADNLNCKYFEDPDSGLIVLDVQSFLSNWRI